MNEQIRRLLRNELNLYNMWEWVKMTSEDIKKKLFDLGADLCGISSIDRFNGAPKGYHPLDILPTCQSVIVFAVRFVSGTLACKSAVPYTVVRNIFRIRWIKWQCNFASTWKRWVF